MGQQQSYPIVESLQQYRMKDNSLCPQIRLQISNICSTYKMSTQTHHTCIQLLMNTKIQQYMRLVEHDQQNQGLGNNIRAITNNILTMSLACLQISQKFHEPIPIPLRELCHSASSPIDPEQIIEMELKILKIVDFRIASELLIDSCMEVAHNWDNFIQGIDCIQVRFISCNTIHPFAQSMHEHNQEMQSQKYRKFALYRNLGNIAVSNMAQICEKLNYSPYLDKYNKLNLSLAIVAIVIKQTQRNMERYSRNSFNKKLQRTYTLLSHQQQSKTDLCKRKYYLGHGHKKTSRNGQSINKSKCKQLKISATSTDYIINDFMREVFKICYPAQLQKQIKFVRSNNFALLTDLTIELKNVANITQISASSFRLKQQNDGISATKRKNSNRSVMRKKSTMPAKNTLKLSLNKTKNYR